jgi:protein gp37
MTGCTKVSDGCDHCYAAVVAERRTRAIYLAQAPVRATPAAVADPFAPRFWNDRLLEPLRWRTPKRIFVNSMSDVFHAHFSLEMIRRVFEVMHEAHWHHFQLLTKRPERALRLANELPWGPNVWIGTSVEHMGVARRVDDLRRIEQAAIRFISAEPLLGPLDALDLHEIDWVIGGGESGAGYRTCDERWALGLRDRANAAGVSFFWKQWGGHTPKAGGRLLGNQEWNEFPLPHPTRGLPRLG